MAEGIKVSELIPAISVANNDLFIIDKLQTNAEYITSSLKFEDLVTSITGRDLELTGDIELSGDVNFNGDVSFSGNINLNPGAGIDTPIIIADIVKDFNYLSSSYPGTVVVLRGQSS